MPPGRRCEKIYFSGDTCEPTGATFKLLITPLNSQYAYKELRTKYGGWASGSRLWIKLSIQSVQKINWSVSPVSLRRVVIFKFQFSFVN